MRTTATPGGRIAYYLLGGTQDDALKLLKLRAHQSSTDYSETHLLALAMEMGDAVQEKASLARMLRATGADKKENQKWPARFSRAVAAVHKAESAGDMPREEIEELLADQDASMGQADAAYFFGKLAALKGFDDAALEYIKKAVDAQDPDRITWHLAKAELTRLEDEAADDEEGEDASKED